MKKVQIHLFAVFFLITGSLHAQQDSLSDSLRKPIFRALPTAYYTPETRIAVEAFAYFSFYTDSAERASNIRLFAAVTQNRQLTIDLPWQVFTAREKYRIAGKADVRKFPEYYYGLGNNTVESMRELYEYRSVGLINRAHRNLWRKNYGGVMLEGRVLNTALPMTPFQTLHSPTIVIGEGGYVFGGLGPSFIHDSRDVILCPQRGRFFELSTTANFGSSDEGRLFFVKLLADYRHYINLPRKTVFAYQMVAQSAVGDVPYRELAALGGPMRHRGYYFGRFRDHHLAFAQAEVRKHLFWRLGAVGFASVGRVYQDFETILLRGYHPAAGGGLRFKLSSKDEANIRFDVSFTPDSRGFYVFFAEAF